MDDHQRVGEVESDDLEFNTAVILPDPYKPLVEPLLRWDDCRLRRRYHVQGMSSADPMTAC